LYIDSSTNRGTVLERAQLTCRGSPRRQFRHGWENGGSGDAGGDNKCDNKCDAIFAMIPAVKIPKVSQDADRLTILSG
jgi:hypothetical protein